MKKRQIEIYSAVELVSVKKTKLHTRILFDLYKNRDEGTKISTNSDLNYEEHKKFVENNPYRFWLILKLNENYIGTSYVKYDNGIGVYLLQEHKCALKSVVKKIKDTFQPLPAKPSERRWGFHMNISQNNTEFEEALKDIGAELMQKTYYLRPENSDG
tara:strand:+ start:224 stop:697 length:474 start_codon:yes stop_codon:yes gene_type:complete